MSSRVSCLRCCLLALGMALCFSGIILTMIGFAIKLDSSKGGCSSCRFKYDKRIANVENCRIAGPTMIVLGIFISAAMCCRGKERLPKAGIKYGHNDNDSVVACSASSQIGHDGKLLTYSTDTGVSEHSQLSFIRSMGQNLGSYTGSHTFFPITRQQAYPLCPQKHPLYPLSMVNSKKVAELSPGEENSPPPPSYTSVITNHMESVDRKRHGR